MKTLPFLLLLLLSGCAVTPPPAPKPAPVAHVKVTEAEKRYFKSAKFDRDLDSLNRSLDYDNALLGLDIARGNLENAERSAGCW